MRSNPVVITGFNTDHVHHRTNTNASAANSPQLASSPVVGNFATAKANSPAPGPMQRAQPVRVRQNSTQSVVQAARQRPSSSASNKGANGNGLYSTAAELDKPASLTGKSVGDTKTSAKEAVHAKGEPPLEFTANGEADMRGGAALVVNRGSERTLKREETLENGDGAKRTDRLPSISTSTRGPKTSKTSTPIIASFPDPPPSRARPSRATESLGGKRSHKKGAGLAAQLAAQAVVAAEDDGGTTSVQGDDEEDEDGEEPRYCYCNQVSYGEMVACDMEGCPREWFHLDCVGLTRAPRGNGEFCFCLLLFDEVLGWLTGCGGSEMVL